MSESIKWGSYEFFIGDKFSIPGNQKVIEILELFQDKLKTYVILKYDQNNPELWEGDEFAYYVEQNEIIPAVAPKYKVNDMFVHQYNNTTVTVMFAAPAIGMANKREYFVLLVEDTGDYTYTSIDEAYLDGCIPLQPTGRELIPRAVIPIGTTFPTTSFVKVTPP